MIQVLSCMGLILFSIGFLGTAFFLHQSQKILRNLRPARVSTREELAKDLNAEMQRFQEEAMVFDSLIQLNRKYLSRVNVGLIISSFGLVLVFLSLVIR